MQYLTDSELASELNIRTSHFAKLATMPLYWLEMSSDTHTCTCILMLISSYLYAWLTSCGFSFLPNQVWICIKLAHQVRCFHLKLLKFKTWSSALIMKQPTAILLCLLQVFTIAKAAAPITQQDRDILVAIRDKFQPRFEAEKFPGQEQYAVVYFGTPSKESVEMINLDECRVGNAVFIVKPDYNFNPEERREEGCSFIAAKMPPGGKRHTEKSCLYSFGQMDDRGRLTYNKCPKPGNNNNLYLFTYYNPCSQEGSKEEDQKYCTDIIKTFAKSECAEEFQSLIIGYEKAFYIYKNTEEISQTAIDSIANAGMTMIDARIDEPREEL